MKLERAGRGKKCLRKWAILGRYIYAPQLRFRLSLWEGRRALSRSRNFRIQLYFQQSLAFEKFIFEKFPALLSSATFGGKFFGNKFFKRKAFLEIKLNLKIINYKDCFDALFIVKFTVIKTFVKKRLYPDPNSDPRGNRP